MTILPNKYLINKKYKILSYINRDKIGIFYKAVNVKTQKNVLIKEIFFRDICERKNYRVIVRGDNSLFENYKLEIIQKSSILKLLKNENLINFIELLQENNTVYFVSEDIEKFVSLEQWRKSFSEQKVIRYIKDISNALLTIHNTRNIHQNIQPSNIFFHKNKFILSDFSLIKSIDEANLSSIYLGNKLYAAPEQFNKNSECSEVTDIYSMGVTLLNLLTGKTHNLKQQDKHNELHKDIFQSYIKRLNIREDLKKIILKMLEYDYMQRYQTVQELLDDIKKLKNLYTLKIRVEPSNASIDFKEVGIEYKDNLRLEEKSYLVTVSCQNYKTQKIDINLDKDKTVNIVLKKNSINKVLLLLVPIIIIIFSILYFNGDTSKLQNKNEDSPSKKEEINKSRVSSSLMKEEVTPLKSNVYFGVESKEQLSWNDAYKFCSEKNERLPTILELKTLEKKVSNQSFWSNQCEKIGTPFEGSCKRVDFFKNGKSSSMLELKKKELLVKCIK